MIPNPNDFDKFEEEEVEKIVNIISSLLVRDGYLKRAQDFCNKYKIRWHSPTFQEVNKRFIKAGWEHSNIDYQWIHISNEEPPVHDFFSK